MLFRIIRMFGNVRNCSDVIDNVRKYSKSLFDNLTSGQTSGTIKLVSYILEKSKVYTSKYEMFFFQEVYSLSFWTKNG